MRQWQNKLFRQNEKKFYSQLVKDKSEARSPPDLVALETFWRYIFENPTKVNLDSSWLNDLQSKLADKYFVVEEPSIDEIALMVVWLSYAIGLLKDLMAFKGFGSNDL